MVVISPRLLLQLGQTFVYLYACLCCFFMVFNVLPGVEIVDCSFQVVNCFFEIFLCNFHFLQKFGFLLFQLPVSFLNQFRKFFGITKYHPSFIQIVFAEPIMECLQDVVDLETFYHVHLDPVHFDW